MFEPQSYPDWLIIGVKHPQGVALYASSDISEIEFEVNYADIVSMFEPESRPMRTTIELQGVLYSFIMVIGTDYADALRRLFSNGDPSQWKSRPQELPPIQKELPDADV